MAGLNIPGVTDQYNTKGIVEDLMKVERVPLNREERQLETLKLQQDAWRDLNTKLTSLRDKTKGLYSFENPFNSKLTTSSDEDAITAEATRSADLQTFKVEVKQIATSDRFLTKELDEDFKVPAGMYTFKVGDKQVNYNWKGGSLKDFSKGINKRGNDVIKSSVIGASKGKVSLLIESVPTGKENKLIFEGQAEKFAFDTEMIGELESEVTVFGTSQEELSPIKITKDEDSEFLPELSLSNTTFKKDSVSVAPRGAYQVEIPSKVKNDENQHIKLSLQAKETEDITKELNDSYSQPELPKPGYAEFKGIVVNNNNADLAYEIPPVPEEPLEPIKDDGVLYAVMEDGSEKEINTSNLQNGELQEVDIDLSLYPDIKAIAIKNRNTGTTIEVSSLSASNPESDLGYGPLHPITIADDAIIKYEGITMTRPSNKIDDVVPEITLNLHDKTEKKPATIEIKPDVEASKDAIIAFVGQYNQAIAELNVLSQNKPEIVEELEYLTDEEKEEKHKKLGIFLSEFTLTSLKSNMQTTVSAGYNFSDNATVTMLSQIGIGTNASGYSGGYSQSKLRGYLEIDEKKLDNALENNLEDIKALFGYDSDGDLIVDSGIAYKIDKQIGAYTQTGGIIALKTSGLDSKIKNSEKKIARLEEQMDEKEAELKYKYGQMEGALNSLESQQNSIKNFSKQHSN